MRTLKILVTAMFMLMVAAVFGCLPAFAGKVEDMMYPSVRIAVGNTTGSGTSISYDGLLGRYVLTNLHVVHTRGAITATFYGDDTVYQAYIHSYDKENDIAVLLVKGKAKGHTTIGWNVDLFDPAFCIGASVGEPLAPSQGIITGTDYDKMPGRKLYRTDCKVAPGNSGGGVYVEYKGRWVFVGIPSMVRNLQVGYVTIPLTFLGLIVRNVEVIRHLKRNNVPYTFIPVVDD